VYLAPKFSILNQNNKESSFLKNYKKNIQFLKKKKKKKKKKKEEEEERKLFK